MKAQSSNKSERQTKIMMTIVSVAIASLFVVAIFANGMKDVCEVIIK